MSAMEWRPIPSFPDYEVSERGDVRRRRVTAQGTVAGKLMKPWVREDGYRMYILRRDKKSFHPRAHQLVAEAFIGPRPFDGAEVCHKDGTRSNDHWENLRWDSRSANHMDKRRHGTSIGGERHHRAKLTREDIAAVFEMRARGMTQRDIGAAVGVRQPHIGRILRGERWNTGV